MNRLNLRSCLILILSAAAAASAQPATMGTAVPAETRTAANDAYQKKDWKTAATNYEKIVQIEEKNAGAHYRLGVALLNIGRSKDASTHLQKAMTISPNAVFGLALARAHSRNGDVDKMYAVFEQSLPLGGIAAESLESEPDFATVKSQPKFVEYSKKLDGVANPCRARPEYRGFDFWIGEWAPQNPQGLTVGTSSIQLILGSCVIFENWNTPASAGKSFSLFDARDGKWHQTWVDARGNQTKYVGGMQDGKMVLIADVVNNGAKSQARMTYSKLADGSVRQHGENSTDDGKTWTTAYDFKYVKAK